MTGTIIQLAYQLGLMVVAEGVEDEKQREYLIKYNCDYVQGYLFNEPLLKNEVLKFMKVHM